MQHSQTPTKPMTDILFKYFDDVFILGLETILFHRLKIHQSNKTVTIFSVSHYIHNSFNFISHQEINDIFLKWYRPKQAKLIDDLLTNIKKNDSNLQLTAENYKFLKVIVDTDYLLIN